MYHLAYLISLASVAECDAHLLENWTQLDSRHFVSLTGFLSLTEAGIECECHTVMVFVDYLNL